MGAYKGSGLSMMMELIPTLLAGKRPVVSPDFHYGNPTLLMALAPGAFDDDTDFAAQVEALKQHVKTVQPAEGFDEVLLPGEPEIALIRRANQVRHSAARARLGRSARTGARAERGAARA